MLFRGLFLTIEVCKLNWYLYLEGVEIYEITTSTDCSYSEFVKQDIPKFEILNVTQNRDKQTNSRTKSYP